MSRKIVILTEGKTNPNNAKTASCVVRYQRDQVLALFDSTQAGKTSGQLLGVGGNLPIIDSLDKTPDADTLLVGIAPSGGKLPPEMKRVVLDAIARKMNIVSGLHEFLCNDPEIASAAKQHGVTLHDVRKNNERDVTSRQNINPNCLRIHTVGHDCSVGKMVVSVEVTLALKKRGIDAKFVATGQTGIMVEGDGCPIDCVVSDFVNGAAEKLVLQNQHHDILLVEGQGSLTHPRYSAVTLGLLHGSMPHGLILCYEMGRTHVFGMDHIPLFPLRTYLELNEVMASTQYPCKVIGIAMNSRRFSDTEAADERKRIKDEFGLPACDVIRNGPDELADACLEFRKTAIKS